MRREALTLVLAMAIGSVAMVACDKPEPRAAASEAPTAGVDSSAPRVAMGKQTAEESRASTPPVQGEVDSKEPAQRRDFEEKK